MICLVYVSAARRPFTPAELADLLDECRRKNAAEGITGVLMYADGNILQALEGEADIVHRLFARIEADARHRQIMRLYETPVDRRQFGRWSMALARPDLLPPDGAVDGIAVLRRSLADPGAGAVKAEVGMLLTLFAEHMR
jgi:hypothetical protein